MTNKKTKFALMLMAIFVAPFMLSACGKNIDNQTENNLNINGEAQEELMIEGGTAIENEVMMDDRIEFSDPGNDEIGREIQEMDDLLNQTTPSEYSEEDLSNSAVEDEVELL